MTHKNEDLRRDRERAAEVFRFVFENRAIRNCCVAAMAESVEIAHRFGPNAWEITLFKDSVHLNVGPIAVLWYFPRRIYCIIDSRSIPKSLRKRDDVRLTTKPNGVLPSVPVSAECEFPAELAETVFPLLRSSHNSLIEAASGCRRATGWAKSYSPGVTEFLSHELGRQLPHPGYYSDGVPAQTNGTKGPLGPFAIYTIRQSNDLDGVFASGDVGQFTERKKWTTALNLLDQAKLAGKDLPILFAAGERIRGLIYWAVITGLSWSDGVMTYSFTGLRRIETRRALSSLRLVSTDEPLSDKFRRPYAIVHTPDYIQDVSEQAGPMDDYVAHHSAKVTGRAYGAPSGRSPSENFSFFSRKPEGYLRKAIGCRAWVISSNQSGTRNRYWLEGMFTPRLRRLGRRMEGLIGWKNLS